MPSGSKIVFLRRNVFTIYLNATLSIEFIARTLGTTGRQSLFGEQLDYGPKEVSHLRRHGRTAYKSFDRPRP